MSFEQQIYGSTDWHFPSPSATPKSVTFPEGVLTTPKADLSQSHFLDAWSTPQINGHRTPVQTPSLSSSTPLERPSSSYSYKPRTPEDPEFHVNHFLPKNLPIPPVDPSRRLSSSPGPPTADKDPDTFRRALPLSERPSMFGMDPSHIQTPPPTRDANSRRSLQQPELATPATVIQRTPAHSAGNNGFSTQTPFGFPSLQFSPDMFQIPNGLPMSAPALPQSRLFWEQSDGNMDVDMPIASDPFGPTPHKIDSSLAWQPFGTPTPQMNPQAFQALHGLPQPQQPTQFASTGFHEEPQISPSRSTSYTSTSVGVDPSVLFSFSSPGLNTSFSSQTNRPTGQDTRQPYETQAQDSLRERELAKKAKATHSRTSTSSSSGSLSETGRPGLQRSNTDSGFRKSRPSSVHSGSSGPITSHHIPRRSSPLKRQSGGHLASIPEIRRPRTRLVIDETGRARTETDPVDEEPQYQDLRRQYPELYNDEDTESDSDQPVLSRNSSFNIPQPQRRASKHARTESGLERSNSFKVPRPSSGVFDKSSFETLRPKSRTADNASRRFSMMEFGSSFGKALEDDPVAESPGDALGALKKVVEGRQKRVDRTAQDALKAHNARWAQASADLGNSKVQYDPFANSLNASPDDTGLTTPSTDRSSLSSEGTRCICNSSEYDGQLMIQCESCTKWLHARCVGLNNQNLPAVFVCIFCTGQTPIARGGRVRGPMPTFDSPLGHKSAYRR